ncbi:MAG: TIGR03084 family metal-binding protein, partial [Pseudomonadota bacterium]
MTVTLPQALDFGAETEVLAALCETLDATDWDRPTAFKGWTPRDILTHLDVWNRGADLAFTDPDAFADWMKPLADALMTGTLRTEEARKLGARDARELLSGWRTHAAGMAERWSHADPKTRVPWAGPSMSLRSSATARQMETWAHGQAIFDLMGVAREDTDRVANVVHMGVQTFGWSYQVRGRPVPEAMPELALTLPSGATLNYGEAGPAGRIAGPAVAFAQVVAQTRNVADTELEVTGPVATEWMSIAQCFAGPPVDPPAPG